ncbi:MAG: type II toxin-antitoxin system RelB/DinJ family antitoxin [Cyanobacteria bacterium P01_C01_bin.89]
MNEAVTVSAQIDAELKVEVERLFDTLGITTAEAIALFYREVKLQNGLPFEISIPNETTEKVFQDTDAGKNLVVAENTEDLFKKLGL